jgi:alanine dehydrogenase
MDPGGFRQDLHVMLECRGSIDDITARASSIATGAGSPARMQAGLRGNGMIVGVPTEVKDRENRVAAPPAGIAELVGRGHQVLVERCAGDGSGFSDAEYERAGAELVDSHAEIFARAEMIMKVKEPVSAEFQYLRKDQLLFTYLHLAADEALTRALMNIGVQAVAYETVQEPNGTLPLLTPMSEVAGRMAVQIGAHYLERTNGGRGVLLGGVPGVHPASVVVIGGGVVGANAAQIALGMGADVTIFDINVERLRQLEHQLSGRLTTLAAGRQLIGDAVRDADLVIGAVLVAGAKAPKLVTRQMVRTMQTGAVIIDVAIDQGGCIETAKPTSHSAPTFEVDGVVHYCVTNMPGAVPRTSTIALSNATLPYALQLAEHGLVEAARQNSALAHGINVLNGRITHQGVADAFGLPYVPWTDALA